AGSGAASHLAAGVVGHAGRRGLDGFLQAGLDGIAAGRASRTTALRTVLALAAGRVGGDVAGESAAVGALRCGTPHGGSATCSGCGATGSGGGCGCGGLAGGLLGVGLGDLGPGATGTVDGLAVG